MDHEASAEARFRDDLQVRLEQAVVMDKYHPLLPLVSSDPLTVMTIEGAVEYGSEMRSPEERVSRTRAIVALVLAAMESVESGMLLANAAGGVESGDAG